MSDNPYLRLHGITKFFGSSLAVQDISLAVEPGAFVCFLGPSGCGKTTLLRIIAGLEAATAGRVEIEGRDVSRLPPSARDYGIVFQSYALFPNLTASQNIAYGLHGRPQDVVRKRTAEMLEMVGLPEIGEKYPSQLSGGQQQRVALARALAPAPRLLLLDEPLSALDARVRVHLRAELRQLHNRLGITTVMVTHDQIEALTIADLIVVMSKGRVEQIGTPTEIYRRPRSPFVAEFVGEMNLLSGVCSGHGRICLGDVDLNCDSALKVGAAVTVYVRPEDVVVMPAPDASNLIEVCIESLEFLGPFHRAHLRAKSLGDLQLTADFSVNLVRDLDLAPGRSLPVRLPQEYLHVFPKRQ